MEGLISTCQRCGDVFEGVEHLDYILDHESRPEGAVMKPRDCVCPSCAAEYQKLCSECGELAAGDICIRCDDEKHRREYQLRQKR